MKFKKTFAKYKVYLDRSRQYTIYVAFFLQGATTIAVWASKHTLAWLKDHVLLSGIIGFLIVLIVHLWIGWVDSKWVFSEENRRHSDANPVVTELREANKEIIERLNRIEQNQNT